MRAVVLVLCSLVGSATLQGCRKELEVKRLDQLWTAVDAAATPEGEAQALEAVWQFAGKEELSVEMVAKLSSGETANLLFAGRVQGIEGISVTFEDHRGQQRSFEWKPVKTDNAYILFREK